MQQLFIVSGPSGTGKGTIVRKVAEALPSLHVSVSYTTRTPRTEDVEGVTYHFVSEETFREMISRDEFLEWAQYPPGTGKFYGTARAEVQSDRPTIVEIELQGARQIKAAMPEAKLIFILPPSVETLRERILGRGVLPEDEMRARLARAEEELREGPPFADFLVTNNDGPEGLLKAVGEVVSIVSSK